MVDCACCSSMGYLHYIRGFFAQMHVRNFNSGDIGPQGKAEGGLQDIEKIIQQYQKALPRAHPGADQERLLNNLADALHTRFKQKGQMKDINEAIELHRRALALRPPPHPKRGISLNNLAIAVKARFNQQGDSIDLEEAIELYREALVVHAPPHPYCAASLSNLATAVQTRFEQQGDSKDIEEAIELQRQGLALRPPPHPKRGLSLYNLASALQKEFEQNRNSKALCEAIELYREALALTPTDADQRGTLFHNLAHALYTKFEHQGQFKDIDEAIQLNREALALCPPPHPQHDMLLNNLGNAVQTRFEQHGDPKDIDEAIELHREALVFRAPPHPEHNASLNNLANAMITRFQQQGNSENIERAIQLFRDALALQTPPHPDRGMTLNNLATAIQTRFEQEGDSKDLNEALELHRQALALLAQPDPDRAKSLNNLANALQMRYERQRDSKDIHEAVELHRAALALRAPPHPDCVMSLNNLANAVQSRFEQLGDPKDIHEAIELTREALAICTPWHPICATLHNNLARALNTRLVQWGDSKDIKEAIQLHRDALALHPSPNPQRANSLSNLASTLQTRCEQDGNSKDLEEAIGLHREALALRGPAHPARGGSLTNLANALQRRSEQQGVSKDIEEAIQLQREALALDPHPECGGCLSNLAHSFSTRFNQQGDLNDICQAIELSSKVLTLHTPPHPDRGRSLHAFGIHLVTRYNHTHQEEDLGRAFALFQEATTYMSSSPLTRFRHARSWAHIADQYNHISALSAYRAAIELLPQLAALHLDLSSREVMLSTTKGANLASAAASCAVGFGQFDVATEFLEASRSVFWSQALHLRKPFHDLALIRPDLSDKLADLSKQLEQASFRETSRQTSDTHHKIKSIESEGNHCRHLNEEWQKIVESVRLLPEFEDFMQPKGINALKEAAISGPIVILTTTDSVPFALIVTSSNEVQCLKLQELILPPVEFLADLTRGLSSPTFDMKTFVATRKQGGHTKDQAELLGRLLGARQGYINMSSDDIFRQLLLNLWKTIVKPVFEALNLEANYVISSYTPTLTALLGCPADTATSFKVTAVIEPNAPNCTPLPGARTELNKIMERVPYQWLTTLVDTTVGKALVHLRESSVVHFACHGVQDLKQPLDSGLILTGGCLKISALMRRPEGEHVLDRQKFMSLAFLSACETAKGDETVPDEAMHLAATLMFSGFHGVVATMCPNSNPPVLPDLTQAAKALHVAVAELREELDIPFRRWVPFLGVTSHETYGIVGFLGYPL
ncbi:hypothetical protein B0H19DRAFT_1348589 [Mycena capillaripes]|nr:hypothetical protein B0H19DRAFT_1348589 [Mycena capillaripes]